MVLSKVIPEWCPLAAPKGISDMFPFISVNFSLPNANETMTAAMAQARSALALYDNTDTNARAATKESSYDAYDEHKKTLQATFATHYYNAGTISLSDEYMNEIKKYVTDSEVSATIGLDGSYTSIDKKKLELKVRVVVLLNVEAQNPKYDFERQEWKQKLEIPSGRISIGPLTFDLTADDAELGIALEANAQVNNLFAGYIGMYGSGATVGADASLTIGWNGVSASFTPKKVATATTSDTFYYFGRKDPNTAINGSGSLTMTPLVTVAPTLTALSCIYERIDLEAQVPVTISVDSTPTLTTTAGLDLEVSASAGLTWTFLIFTYKYPFAEWSIVDKYFEF
jgi:hypothetical protein